ncbi:phage holin family protein [Truepera radiovictrix]|uniref:Phage holin family protein n=1 Tax=Truepera radiovictrix (strain DSM 17093 / CIP 108686 / LMG 22925 / RQ-24) TaxID=649638 RepID=D7CRY6_TRURR|nr:phage holin family protein [Truepera radiovictrix]ADI15314.1 protein of unknown function DUF1469 [Truepera radiovictrix DSM 17093]WMT56135.1 phage holin family protein [Truepera radiovictrix]
MADARTREVRERDTRPLGELLSKLASDVSLLVRQEVALAKKEFSQTLGQAVGGAVVLIIGAVLAIAGTLALLAALILALSLVMAPWAAALVVGLGFLLIGAILAVIGINRLKKLQLVPERTARTLQEDAEMVREKVR